MSTEYCTSCNSPGEIDEYRYLKIEVIPLYNGVRNRWKDSSSICEECVELFLDDFQEKCLSSGDVVPEPSDAKSSRPCECCGEHLFKNDALCRVQLGHKYRQGVEWKYGICYQCLERHFNRFNVPLKEPLRKVGPLSVKESKDVDSSAECVSAYVSQIFSALR